jgi:hypothetical protein
MIALPSKKEKELKYSEYLSEAKKEIDFVIGLIKNHNQVSYKKLVVDYETVKFKTNSIISDFMEQYLTLVNATTMIKNAYSMTNYSHDDIHMNVDRSIDYVIELFSTLSKVRDDMKKHISLIEFNMDRCIDSYNGIISADLKSLNDDDIIDFISKTYKQMKENNVFIEYGSRLISIIIRWIIPQNKQNVLDHITDLNYQLKKEMNKLDGILTKKVHTNRLQRFGLVPDEGTNESLSNVIKRLFGLSIDVNSENMVSIETFERIIKILQADTGVSTGIILIVSPNTNIYFNMTDLFKRKAPPAYQGITKDMINRYELIETYSTSESVKKSQLIVLGKDIKVGYVLWTNDMKKFKWKSNTIDHKYLDRIIRNSPSDIVQSINDKLEKLLEIDHADDIVEFNKVKNMAFNEKHTEEIFLETLATKIFDILKKHNNMEKTNTSLFKVFESMKQELGAHRKLNGHTQVIYASMAFDIINKLKAMLYSGYTFKNLAEVRVIVSPNDNIYSRVISSYYLHTSKN